MENGIYNESLTYLDFANDSYNLLKLLESYGVYKNTMASVIHNTCERYMKHIIYTYDFPNTEAEAFRHNNVLRSHSLVGICAYLEHNMNIPIPDDIRNGVVMMNDVYFTTRYPGRESRMTSSEEVESYMRTMDKIKEMTYSIMNELENSRNINNEEEER